MSLMTEKDANRQKSAGRKKVESYIRANLKDKLNSKDCEFYVRANLKDKKKFEGL